MPEVTRKTRQIKVLRLSINEIVFGESKNRFFTIPGGNIKIMVSGSSMALVPFVSSLSILDSMRASVIKPWLFSMRNSESTWYVCLHSRDNHLCDALGTLKRVSVLDAL